MRTFQLIDAKNHRFWNIDVHGTSFTVTFGRIGTTGQKKTKSFATPGAARKAANKRIAEKAEKGYVETAPNVSASGAEAPEAAAFENVLIESPDDLAGWCAYADYLVERNDPRGEFMQVQIGLEDGTRPKRERNKLKEKEKTLLKEHEREWLGGLAPFVSEEEEEQSYSDYPPRAEPYWSRGCLTHLVVKRLDITLAQALASIPAARFVRDLQVHSMYYHGYYGEDPLSRPKPRVPTPQNVQRHSALFELIGSNLLRNLRCFQIGPAVEEDEGVLNDRWAINKRYYCGFGLPGLEHVVASMLRLEELHLYCKSYNLEGIFSLQTLSELRVLRIYHVGVHRSGHARQRYEYELDVLAQNPALANLTHLLFHPHHEEYYWNSPSQPRLSSFLPLDQVQALVRSKHLPRLTHLQIRLSNMGDEGVREIVSSGVLKRLKWLDLRHGCITNTGARVLAEAPDIRNLEHLDLSRNAVTRTGLSLLRRTGINVRADYPLTPEEVAGDAYLYEGDSE